MLLKLWRILRYRDALVIRRVTLLAALEKFYPIAISQNGGDVHCQGCGAIWRQGVSPSHFRECPALILAGVMKELQP